MRMMGMVAMMVVKMEPPHPPHPHTHTLVSWLFSRRGFHLEFPLVARRLALVARPLPLVARGGIPLGPVFLSRPILGRFTCDIGRPSWTDDWGPRATEHSCSRIDILDVVL